MQDLPLGFDDAVVHGQLADACVAALGSLVRAIAHDVSAVVNGIVLPVKLDNAVMADTLLDLIFNHGRRPFAPVCIFYEIDLGEIFLV